MVFADYASFYDILNQDKDYVQEAQYIHDSIQKHGPQSGDILDLGCGTGRHDRLLSEKGWRVTGVDMSAQMLVIAESTQKSSTTRPIEYLQGDIRNIRLEKIFDAVISVFHVMSYQISNRDLGNVFLTAHRHLKEGGIFFFDFWYGPAVLTQLPAPRIKRVTVEGFEIIRFAEPRIHPQENIVDVAYQIFSKDLKKNNTREINEMHSMRYLFKPEIEMLAASCGFHQLSFKEWLTDGEPGFSTWSVCCTLRKDKGVGVVR